MQSPAILGRLCIFHVCLFLEGVVGEKGCSNGRCRILLSKALEWDSTWDCPRYSHSTVVWAESWIRTKDPALDITGGVWWMYLGIFRCLVPVKRPSPSFFHTKTLSTGAGAKVRKWNCGTWSTPCFRILHTADVSGSECRTCNVLGIQSLTDMISDSDTTTCQQGGFVCGGEISNWPASFYKGRAWR